MTSNDLMKKILKILPTAVFEEDLEGQVIIYTGLREIKGGKLIKFVSSSEDKVYTDPDEDFCKIKFNL